MIIHILCACLLNTQLYLRAQGEVIVCHFHENHIDMTFSLILNIKVVVFCDYFLKPLFGLWNIQILSDSYDSLLIIVQD
jgi:hypothetical protein